MYSDYLPYHMGVKTLFFLGFAIFDLFPLQDFSWNWEQWWLMQNDVMWLEAMS